MNVLIYDGSFYGLLSAIFEVYEYAIPDPSITRHPPSGSLFGSCRIVDTDPVKSERVIAALKAVSKKAMEQVYKTFLSELPGSENIVLRYTRYILSEKKDVSMNYNQPDVLLSRQISEKVDRERHRVKAFVRFSLTKDQLYFAIMQPDFNVLPLVAKHFRDRYADQRWLIFDSNRKYGIFYDLAKVEEVQLDFTDSRHAKGQGLELLLDESEAHYQQLWQQYFKSVNIAARKNTRLHIRHMPKRYWKHLVEKKTS